MLTPAGVVGPGYVLLPGENPGVYSFPGFLPGLSLTPEGYLSEELGGDVSAHLAVSQLSVSQGTLSPAVPVGGLLGLDSAISAALPADSPISVGLTPA